jgi:signal transduction histidine kinase
MSRRRPRSARLRLAVLFAATFLLLGTVAVLTTYLLASHVPPIAVARLVHASGGTTVTFAVPVPPSAPRIPARSIHSRVRLDPVTGVVAQQHSADARALLLISWFVLAITAVIAGALGWLVAGRVLRPLRAMTDKARTISAGNLGERLAPAGPDDEFKQLGDTFDDLLGRLQASFEAQRRFVANASHELRTPLTFDRTLLQVALADPDATPGTLRATCEELLASGREQERLIDALLTLASSERGLARHDQFDLADIAREVVGLVSAQAEQHKVTIAAELAPGPGVGDRALVERLVSNLLDNAIRYNRPGGRVEVRTGVQDGAAVLVVANTGDVIPADEVDELFEPFRRLRGLRPAGDDGHHGLGLSIVRAIAASHGAALSAAPGEAGGLVVTIRFPASGAL